MPESVHLYSLEWQSAALIHEQRRSSSSIEATNPHERLYIAAVRAKAKQQSRERDANVSGYSTFFD